MATTVTEAVPIEESQNGKFDSASASASTSSPPSKRQKVNEFNDGRKVPKYTWGDSFRDWFKQGITLSDSQVEKLLLSYLPFFPNPDATRRAEIIDTDIGDGNYIHEFYVENTEKATDATPVTDIVLVHGYAASLGLFIDNFDSLSRIPGIRVHAIDLLGFGFSSRPKFPSFPSKTKEDLYKVEDWFIDAMEEWRKKRKINRFILMGHSFGGYLSSAYALKYRDVLDPESGERALEKLVLISPVGVERSKFSLLGDVSAEEEASSLGVDFAQEINANQEDIVEGTEPEHKNVGPQPGSSFGKRVIAYLWEKNCSPFSILRASGPLKLKYISNWTTHRFSHVYFENRQHFQNIHDYMFRIFNAKGSGEFALTRVLAVGAVAKLPLAERLPQKFVDMKLPTLWIYGDKDWMNDEAGLEVTKEINKLSEAKYGTELSQFSILQNAGHHVYLDNPAAFARLVTKFVSVSK